MARFKDQEQRRESLVEAALSVLRESGAAGLRIRDVADRAGVSTGTVHYYFDDTQGLLREVHARARRRFYDERLSDLTRIHDARDKLVSTIRAGVPSSTEDDLVASLYQLNVQLRFQQDNVDLFSALYNVQVAMYVGILEVGVAQGHFALAGPVEDLAQNLVALEDAYGYHVVTGHRTLDYARTMDLICGHARLATGCADITPDREIAHD